MTHKIFCLLSLCLFSCCFGKSAILEKGVDTSLGNTEMKGSNDSNLTNLEAEPSSTIHNCVSVISGDYTESFTDHIIQGPEPLAIQRVYSSGEQRSGSLAYG